MADSYHRLIWYISPRATRLNLTFYQRALPVVVTLKNIRLLSSWDVSAHTRANICLETDKFVSHVLYARSLWRPSSEGVPVLILKNVLVRKRSTENGVLLSKTTNITSVDWLIEQFNTLLRFPDKWWDCHKKVIWGRTYKEYKPFDAFKLSYFA